MAFDRNRFRQGLAASTQKSSETVDDRGGFRSYVKKGKRPRFTKIPEGTLVFDIIPYIIDKDFGDITQRFTAGSLQYNLDLWVHQNVGVNNDQVVCLSKTFGKPCPICEEKSRQEARLANMDEKERREALRAYDAKRRCLYNVWIHDTSRTEEAKGVQILEIAHYTLERNLINIAQNPITGAMCLFADPDTGKHICFTRKGTGMKNTTYEGHQLLDRRSPVPDAILEQAEDLTTLIDIPTYQQVYAMLHATPANVQTEDTSIPPQYGESVGSAGSVSGVINSQTSQNYAAYGAIGGSEQYNEVPFTPNVPSTPAPSQFVYNAPAPAPVYAAPTPTVVCPMEQYGGKFGDTLDRFPQCGSCEHWDHCALEHDNKNK